MSDMNMGQPPMAGNGGGGLKIPILFGAVIALLASNVWLFLQLDKLRGEMDKVNMATEEKLSDVRQTATATTQTSRRNLEAMQEQLETARRQAAMAVGQAKVEADSKVTAMASRLEAEQKKTKEQLSTEITQKVGEASAVADTKVNEVKTEVSAVKTDVSATRSELEKTIANLTKVTGDLGVQSGFIATNGTEIAALRRLGERNYYEFNLGKTKTATRVGDIMVLLKRTDPKKNRYTIEVTVDDQHVEKKDKTVNEPVQFLTSKARQPYELVVNQIKKDVIVGYLATPKVLEPRK